MSISFHIYDKCKSWVCPVSVMTRIVNDFGFRDFIELFSYYISSVSCAVMVIGIEFTRTNAASKQWTFVKRLFLSIYKHKIIIAIFKKNRTRKSLMASRTNLLLSSSYQLLWSCSKSIRKTIQHYWSWGPPTYHHQSLLYIISHSLHNGVSKLFVPRISRFQRFYGIGDVD